MPAYYRTGQVERLLGVGEHVLRYWERELPLLSAPRSAFGRKEWTEADMVLLSRIKHLVRERGFSLARALECVIVERSADADMSAALTELRGRLVKCFFEARDLAERAKGLAVRADAATAAQGKPRG